MRRTNAEIANTTPCANRYCARPLSFASARAANQTTLQSTFKVPRRDTQTLCVKPSLHNSPLTHLQPRSGSSSRQPWQWRDANSACSAASAEKTPHLIKLLLFHQHKDLTFPNRHGNSRSSQRQLIFQILADGNSGDTSPAVFN